MVVALAMGRSGMDQLLVISQVVLSIVLPFVMFPLLWLTTSKKIMSVKKSESDLPTLGEDDSPLTPEMTPVSKFMMPKIDNPADQDVEVPLSPVAKMVDYSNGKIVAGLGYLIWTVVVVANAYVIVMLAMGKSG